MEPTRSQVFRDIEKNLVSQGSKNLPVQEIRAELDKFRIKEVLRLSDGEHFKSVINKVFYAGFGADKVNAKLPAIYASFPDYNSVAAFTSQDIERISADPKVIRNRRKIAACVSNAKQFKQIVEKHSSFQRWLDSFGADKGGEGLERLHSELVRIFQGFGPKAADHFLTDLGYPILKPDRVVRRVMSRLGWLTDDADDGEIISVGLSLAEETGEPIRYIDIVLVYHGQVSIKAMGIEQGICVENNPRCDDCGVAYACQYYASGSRQYS